MADRVVAIAGASGFVGSAAAQRFAEDGWHVIGLSRRRPAKTLPGVEYLAIDLLDSKSCEEVTERLERSEEHTSELQSLMRISYAVFCLKKKNVKTTNKLILLML